MAIYLNKIILLTLLFVSTSLFAGVAKVVALKGEATIVRNGSDIVLTRDSELFKEDKISTKENTKIQLMFIDQTIISIGKNSTFLISDYLYDEKNNEYKAEFSMFKGTFRTITGKIGKIAPEKFKLKTKSASIGIRGTQIVMDLSPNTENIFCTEGKIFVERLNTGMSAVVQSGEFVSFQKDTKNFEVNKINQSDINKINKDIVIEKNLARDNISLNSEEQNDNTENKITTQEIKNDKEQAKNTNQESENTKSSVALTESSKESENNKKVTDKVEEAEAKKTAQEQAVAEAQKIAQEQAAVAEAQRIAELKIQKLAKEQAVAAEAQRLAKVEVQKLVPKQAAAIETQKVADLEVQRLAQEQASAAEIQRLATLEVQRLAQENATAEVQAAAVEAQRLAELEVQKLIQEQAIATEAQRLAILETQRLAQEQAVANEAQRLADLEAQRLVQEQATNYPAGNLMLFTAGSYYENNTSKATYIGNFNSVPFSDIQYVLFKNQSNKQAIPTDTSISMNIDFGKVNNQVKKGEISIPDYKKLEFQGSFNSDKKLDLRGVGNTEGTGTSTLYGPQADIMKGNVELKNNDLALEGHFEADKYDYNNDLDKLTKNAYFNNNTSTASYLGAVDTNDYKNATISMDIDFGATSNQISKGKINVISKTNLGLPDFTFTGDIDKKNHVDFTPTGLTSGSGKADFYGNEANIIKGGVNFTNGLNNITGDFEANKR
jgi:hypothetical protein